MKEKTKDFYKKTAFNTVISVARAGLFILLAFVIIYPFFTQITSMFMMTEDVYDSTVRYIPKHFTTENLTKAAQLLQIKSSLILTVLFTFAVAVLQTFSCTLVGYGLARLNLSLISRCLCLQLSGL